MTARRIPSLLAETEYDVIYRSTADGVRLLGQVGTLARARLAGRGLVGGS